MICFHQSVIKKCYYHRHIVSLVERIRQNVLPDRVAEVYVLYTRGNEVRLVGGWSLWGSPIDRIARGLLFVEETYILAMSDT